MQFSNFLLFAGDIIDQGKNVVIFGVQGAAYTWQCLRYRWPNKVWPHEVATDMRQTISELSSQRPSDFFWYKAECTPNGPMIVRSIGGVPGVVAADCAEEKFEFVEDVAAALNHLVNLELNEHQILPFNALSTDYVNDEVIAKILELNQHAETGVYTTAEISAAANLTSEADDDVFADAGNTTITSFEMPLVPGKTIEVKETNM